MGWKIYTQVVFQRGFSNLLLGYSKEFEIPNKRLVSFSAFQTCEPFSHLVSTQEGLFALPHFLQFYPLTRRLM